MQGQVVLVSGGAAGIGAATAAELARRGARLLLFDRDGAALAATAASITQHSGTEVATQIGDTTVAADCAAAVALAVQRFGGIDIAWANAGIASFGPIGLTDPVAWVRTIEVNLVGSFRLVDAAVAAVRARRGLVVVTASAASFGHMPGMSAYAASKAAVEAACNAWRIELAHHGVQVLAIHPSWIGTAMVAQADQHSAFRALRAALPALLAGQTAAEVLAVAIADAMQQRRRRLCLPGWVRWAYWLRSLLNTPLAERDYLKVAPEVERLFAAEVAARGRAGASVANPTGH